MTTNIMLAVGGNWFGVAWYWYVLALIALVLQSGFVLNPLVPHARVGVAAVAETFQDILPGAGISLGSLAAKNVLAITKFIMGWLMASFFAWTIFLA